MIDILIPVHEESENINVLIEKINTYINSEYKIYFIYDKSSDPTVSRIKKLIFKNKKIYLIQNQYKKGFLNAIKTGIKKSRSDVLCIMMGDLSDDPRDIDKMYKRILDGDDLVCASRYSKGGKRLGGSRLKGLFSYVACASLKKLVNLPTYDATNAFKMFRRALFNEITIESTKGFEFPLELTVKSYFLNKKISEIPTKWTERDKGRSKFKFFELIPYYLKWYKFALTKKYL